MANRERIDVEPKQAREDVEKLLNTLAPMLRIAGIPETQINVASGRKYRTKHFAMAFDWLHQFSLSPQYETFCEVYALRPAHVWESYSHLGIEGLREQDMLHDAGKALAKRWRVKRPRMFGKDKPNVETEEESEQNIGE